MARNKKNWDYLVDYRGQYQPVLGTGQKGNPSTVPGPQGVQGIQGPQGIQGIQGPDGDKGAPGPVNPGAFVFIGQVANQAALPTTGNSTGDTWQTVDDDALYSWDGTQWLPLGAANTIAVKGEPGVQGTQGEKGDAATVAAGATTTAAFGIPAAVSNSGTAVAAIFDFTIPQGEKGAPGAFPLISSLPVLP